jgi:hypothetical protein
VSHVDPRCVWTSVDFEYVYAEDVCERNARLFSRGHKIDGSARSAAGKQKTFPTGAFYGTAHKHDRTAGKDFGYVPVEKRRYLRFVIGAEEAAPPKKEEVRSETELMTYEALLDLKDRAVLGSMKRDALETYLVDEDFAKTFGCDKEAFKKLPKWKRDDAKKKAKLY